MTQHRDDINDENQLTVIIAVFNEADNLLPLHQRVVAALTTLPKLPWQIHYVDDGSGDETWTVIEQLVQQDAPRVAGIRLSRNFGKELAMTAAIDQVQQGAVLLLDGDGQDPPEIIPQFVQYWQAGYDNVFGVRLARAGETWFKRVTASGFYRLLAWMSRPPIPVDTGEFRLLSARLVAVLRTLRERRRFMKGLFAWAGFRAIEVRYERQARLTGQSKYSLWRLWQLALDGITSFSTMPLRLATYLGLLTACLALFFGAWIVIRALRHGDSVPGWPSLMTVILLLGGIQLIAIGMIGEYLGRVYEEVKQRPLYIVRDRVGQWSTTVMAETSQLADAHRPDKKVLQHLCGHGDKVTQAATEHE